MRRLREGRVHSISPTSPSVASGLKGPLQVGAEASIESNAAPTLGLTVAGASSDEHSLGGDDPVERELRDLTIKPLTFEAQSEIGTRIRKGEITPSELVHEWERFKAARPALRAELESLSKSKMIERLKGLFRINSETKSTQKSLVKSVLDAMANNYQVTGAFSWSPFTETHDEAMNRVIGSTTEADIATHASKVAENRERRKEELAKIKAAIENPETLVDFETRAHYKATDLTADQQRKWDELKADAQRAATAPKVATVEAVSIGDVAMEMHPSKHTKTGEPVFVVTMSQRVDRGLYDQLNDRAKALGGYYSSYRGHGAIPGFTFKDEAKAKAFMATQVDQSVPAAKAHEERVAEKQAKASSKLRDLADTMIEKAEDELGRDRKTNTHRRADQAASTLAKAEAQKALGQTMLNLAEAIEDGRAKHLAGLKNRAQVETLDGILQSAKGKRDRAHEAATGNRTQWEETRHRPANLEDIDHAAYPVRAMHALRPSSLSSTCALFSGTKATKWWGMTSFPTSMRTDTTGSS